MQNNLYDSDMLCSPDAAPEQSKDGGVVTCGQTSGVFVSDNSCGFLMPNGGCFIVKRHNDRIKRGVKA